MIRFSCKCGFEFNLTDDRAGAMVQCPRCALLVDAPRADELAWMGPDGTLAIDESADPGPPVPGQTLAEMYRTFSRKATDDRGEPLDRRGRADAPDVQTHQPERIAPRYDPVTGERIIPLALREEKPQPVIAMAVEADPSEIDTFPDDAASVMAIPVASAGPVRSLGYATGDAGRAVTVKSLAADLLARPANVTVLFFVFWFYVAAALLAMPLVTLADVLHVPPAVANLLNVPLWLLAAHYGCVVQETGPELMDELPRPLRNLDLGEDLFGPAVRVAAAAAICYGPMVAVAAVTGMAKPQAAAGTLLLMGLGSLLFPAVVLTLLTGTTVLNLAPHRVIGVMVECGSQYVVSAIGAAAVLALSAGVVLGPAVLPVLERFKVAHLADGLAAQAAALTVTVYVTHAFAFHLGFLYRAHHHGFPWLAQRHVPTPRAVKVRA